MISKTISKILMAASALGIVLSPALASAATITVGPAQTHATIQAAIFAAAPGDTIEVYTGTYDEALWIDRPVNVVEAAGNTAEVRISAAGNTPAGQPDGIDITAPGVTWDGVDYKIAKGTLSMVFWLSGPGGISFSNMSITDTAASAGAGANSLFMQTGTGALVVDNVTVTLTTGATLGFSLIGNSTAVLSNSTFDIPCRLSAPATAEMITGDRQVAGNTGTLTATNCEFKKSFSPTPIATDSILRPGPDWVQSFTKCTFRIAPTASRLQTGFAKAVYVGAQQTTTFNDCIFDATTHSGGGYRIFGLGGAPNTQNVGLTNCAFYWDPAEMGASNAAIAGGGIVTVNYCTFAATTSSADSRPMMQSADAGAGQGVTWTINDSLASIPGSTMGFLTVNGGANVAFSANKNLRYNAGGVVGVGASAETLPGTVITGDPLLDSDFIHLTAGSAAIDAAADATQLNDIDGNGARPNGAANDLGADEFNSVPVEASSFEID